MIREPKEDVLSINVILKNGETYMGKDIPPNPLGAKERIVSFWHGDAIRVYPMEQIKYFELIETKPE